MESNQGQIELLRGRSFLSSWILPTGSDGYFVFASYCQLAHIFKTLMHLKDHLEKLEYFCAVAHEGSFRRAASRLNLSQPSLTRAVSVLEEVIGKPLFRRQLQRISLTPEGLILTKYCEELFSSIKDLEQRLEYPEEPMSGVIRIGTYDSIAIYFWPEFLKYLSKKYPSLKIELKTGRSAALAQDLMSTQLDFTLTIEPHLHAHFEVIELYKDVFHLYYSPQLKIKETRKLPLILMADALSTAGEVLEESLIKAGYVYEKKFVVSSLETAKEFAKNELGIAVLPTQVARIHERAGILKKLNLKSKTKIGEHRICAALSKDRLKLPTYQALIHELQTFSKEWLQR